ncbi:Na+/H+ antiporter subunit E [Saccharopolyspora rectivirgula]|uniref:Na+/H+ antiporter subunit E n=1 Tax=Saccharopolyspora rectivirgula TaxID=28042 RepID=UPI0004118D73|nr:Na+/H+ antiporter subunit E [Saccharopolyspora rectivirgula]
MTSHAFTRRRRLLARLPMVAWLTLVWVLLWGTFDIGTFFFGLVVAVLVVVAFPTPVIRTNVVLRPVRVVQLALYVAWDLVVSTLRVAWQAVRYGPNAEASIVSVRLRTDSDHIAAILANAISLAPGQFVMHLDRPNRLFYVYALGTTESGVEQVRQDVLKLEKKVVRAVGSPRDLQRILQEEAK